MANHRRHDALDRVSTSSAADAASARIGTTCYWDAQDRLVKATHLAGTVTNTFTWEYDYRTRRIGLSNSHGVLASGAGVATDQPTVTVGHVAFVCSGVKSDAVTNKKDPIGPERQDLLTDPP